MRRTDWLGPAEPGSECFQPGHGPEAPPGRDDHSHGLRLEPRRSILLFAAACVGAVWGAASYALLWGYTPIFIERRFVVSPLGLASLFPARVVLDGIHFVERHVAGHPFDFSRNNAWIGSMAALVGASLMGAAVVLAQGAIRRLRRKG